MRNNGLTFHQIERQDFVDIEIKNLIKRLLPLKYDANKLYHDMSWIAEIRDIIRDYIVSQLKIPEDEQDKFDMLFYPFITEEEVGGTTEMPRTMIKCSNCRKDIPARDTKQGKAGKLEGYTTNGTYTFWFCVSCAEKHRIRGTNEKCRDTATTNLSKL